MLDVIASIVLGCAMCAAGAAKIVMGSRWPVEAASMGAPHLIVPLLPWVEIGMGAFLLAQWQRETIAIVVGVLMVGFSMAIAMNLAQGRHPTCACFGSWSARPLGWRHLVRNAVLLILAVVIWL